MLTESGHATILHAHLFAGLGGGARGFNRATSRVGNLTASFRCLGGIDVDAAAIRDFGRLAGVPGTWDLARDGGTRRCVLTLSSESGEAGRRVAFPAGCRKALPILNGIAHIDGDEFLITGKYWPKMFRVRLDVPS